MGTVRPTEGERGGNDGEHGTHGEGNRRVDKSEASIYD